MSGKGTYLGGGTIVSPRKRTREDGWEPRSKVLGPATRKKKRDPLGDQTDASQARTYCPELGRDATQFEIAVLHFAKEWAQSKYSKIGMPPIPEIIRQRYGSRTAQYLKSLRKLEFGKMKVKKKGAAKPSNG